MIISLAILLAGDFSRRGQTTSIQIAIAAVVAIQTFAIGMRNLSNEGAFAIPFMYASVVVPVVIGLVLLTGARHRPGGRTAPPASAAPS